ncbi:MAG: hypothetical protein QF848_01160 [Planctomycetota bacterium]|nr:hypothetical protein [Planctomycetota bacterium]
MKRAFPLLTAVAALFLGCATPPPGPGAMQRAEVAEAQGRLVEAASWWQEALEGSGGRSTRAARGLARVLSARGDRDGALRILVSTLPPAGVEDVMDAQFLEDLAHHYSRLGAYEKAISTLRVAALRDPDRPSTPILLAELLLKVGEVELAASPLLRSVDARPGHRPTHLALATVLESQEQWSLALEQYQVAARLSSLGVDECLRASRCVLALPPDEGRIRWAVLVTAWLEVHGSPESQRGVTLRAFGELYLASGKALEASALLERVVGADPGDTRAILALVGAYLKSEQCRRALSAAAHARGLDLTEVERVTLGTLEAEIKEVTDRLEAAELEDPGDDRRGP